MNINLNEFVQKLYQQANEKDLMIEIGINHFLSYVKMNKRDGTYRYYRETFKAITNYFDVIGISYFSQLSTEVLINYTYYLQGIGNKPVSINKKIGAIKTLCKYIEDLELINHIEFKIRKLKEVTPKIETVDFETLQKVVTQLRKHHSNQHQLIFELMLSTGVRRTELLHIERKNINFNENYIYLERTKSGYPRFLYFDNIMAAMIKYELTHKPISNYLFVTSDGKQLTTSMIDSMFYRIKKELNLERLSPHLLRHTYATTIMKEKHDIEQVRVLLGHQTYEMSKRYLHLEESTTKQTSLNCNPLTKIKRE